MSDGNLNAQQNTPARIVGAEAWHAADVAASTQWRVELDSATADELAQTARRVAADGAPAHEVDRHRFPLGRAQQYTEQVHEHVERATGFALLSGLPFTELGHEEQIALTCAIADHVGRVVVQNYEGQRIVDVRDEGIAYSHHSRGYRSNKLLPFHTDGANLFVLACLGEAESGGETILASASAVYNTLADEYPETIAILQRGFYHHRRGQHDPGEAPLSAGRVPVFAFHKGLLHCCYNRNPIDWAQKEGVVLNDAEVAALDALDTVLARDAMQLRLRLQAGDALFVNNFISLHSRTEYQDSDVHRRHMFRVWMNDPRSLRSGKSLLELYVPASMRGV
ncbi:MAG: alpha-ketoglutarate-dependent taurine dioxygenase [Gammaproteobacteria bacterium]|jgi:alpha-ketoglutarate-dependent taurine dioxygenase